MGIFQPSHVSELRGVQCFGGKSTLETWSGLDQLDDWLQAEHAGASQILLPLGLTT